MFLEIQFVKTKCEHSLTLNLAQLDSENLPTAISSEGVSTPPVVSLCVTGALCRKTDRKIATVPKTQSRSKDQNKDKDNSK